MTDNWHVRMWLGGRVYGPHKYRERKGAQNYADRDWRGAFVVLENVKTAEKWHRRGGSWFKVQPAQRGRKAAAAQVDG